MTEGAPLPLILNFTFPLLLGNILQQTYSLVDAAIVGKFLGINDLAAIGASTSVVFLILGFCNGCCCGFGIPVAQKFGARDYKTMRRFVTVSLQLAALMSIVIAVLTSVYCADILRSMQTPKNIFHGAYYYLLVTFIGVPCTFFYNLLSSIIRALGDSKTPFPAVLYRIEHRARPVLHPRVGMGRVRSWYRHRRVTRCVGTSLLFLYVQAFSGPERDG